MSDRVIIMHITYIPSCIMRYVGASQPPKLGSDGIPCIIEIMQYYPMHYYLFNCRMTGPSMNSRPVRVRSKYLSWYSAVSGRPEIQDLKWVLVTQRMSNFGRRLQLWGLGDGSDDVYDPRSSIIADRLDAGWAQDNRQVKQHRGKIRTLAVDSSWGKHQY